MLKEKLFAEMLKAYINDTEWLVSEDLLTNDFLNLVESQDLLAMLYLMLAKNQIKIENEELLATLRAIYMTKLAESYKQMLVKDKIEAICKKNNIKHCFFKGADLKSLYGENPEVRSMGDIDVLVDDGDRNFVISELLGKDNNAALSNVEDIDVNGVSVELHKEIKYFGKLIVNVDDIDENNKLDTTHYLFLLVAHIIKHIITSGCGLRQFADIALFIKNFSAQIDNVKLLELFESIDKKKSAMLVLQFACKLFDVQMMDIDFSESGYDQMFEDEFLYFATSNGVFGFDEVGSMGTNKVVKFKESRFPKLRTLLYYAFPPVSDLQSNYPKVNKYKILLPYYYLCNICRRLFLSKGKGKAIFKSVSSVDMNSDRNKFLQKLQVFE